MHSAKQESAVSSRPCNYLATAKKSRSNAIAAANEGMQVTCLIASDSAERALFVEREGVVERSRRASLCKPTNGSREQKPEPESDSKTIRIPARDSLKPARAKDQQLCVRADRKPSNESRTNHVQQRHHNELIHEMSNGEKSLQSSPRMLVNRDRRESLVHIAPTATRVAAAATPPTHRCRSGSER